MSLIDPDSEIIVQSLTFPGEGTIEVSFLEKRDQRDNVGMVKTLFVDVRAAKLRQVHAELLELGQEVVDAGLLLMRAPEDSLDPRRRFRERKKTVSDEPDIDEDLDEDAED